MVVVIVIVRVVVVFPTDTGSLFTFAEIVTAHTSQEVRDTSHFSAPSQTPLPHNRVQTDTHGADRVCTHLRVGQMVIQDSSGLFAVCFP